MGYMCVDNILGIFEMAKSTQVQSKFSCRGKHHIPVLIFVQLQTHVQCCNRGIMFMPGLLDEAIKAFVCTVWSRGNQRHEDIYSLKLNPLKESQASESPRVYIPCYMDCM